MMKALLILAAGGLYSVFQIAGVSDSSTYLYSTKSQSAALDAKVRSGDPQNKQYLIEGITGGVCLIDFDGDGYLDIYVVNGSTIEEFLSGAPTAASANFLFRNLGDGGFEDVTAQAGVGHRGWGMGCSVADFDNDGNPDLYVTNFGSNVLYRNKGDGTFEDVSRRSGVDHAGWGTGSSWGDYDNDGYLDLYLANYVDLDLTKPPPKTQGEFCSYMGLSVMCGPQGLPGAADVLFRNLGDGTFSDNTVRSGLSSQHYYGLGVVSLDYDNDGFLDIFVANDSTPNFLYRNMGDGTFAEVGLLSGVALNEDGASQACMGVAVADYDDDGNLDIFVTNFAQDTNTLYRNLGNGFFLDVTSRARLRDSFPYMGWGTAFIDYNLNGRKDLIVINGHLYPDVDSRSDLAYRQLDLLYRNEGRGVFTNVSSKLAYPPHVGRGAAFGDLNNNGSIDAVIVDLDGLPYVFYNQYRSVPGNNWLLVKLVGKISNRDAVGARAWLQLGGKPTLLQEVGSGSSYLSGNDRRLHFGLAQRRAAEKLFVRWPTGVLQILEDVEANQFLVVEEPDVG